MKFLNILSQVMTLYHDFHNPALSDEEKFRLKMTYMDKLRVLKGLVDSEKSEVR